MISVFVGILIGIYLTVGMLNVILASSKTGFFGGGLLAAEVAKAWLLWPWNLAG